MGQGRATTYPIYSSSDWLEPSLWLDLSQVSVVNLISIGSELM